MNDVDAAPVSIATFLATAHTLYSAAEIEALWREAHAERVRAGKARNGAVRAHLDVLVALSEVWLMLATIAFDEVNDLHRVF